MSTSITPQNDQAIIDQTPFFFRLVCSVAEKIKYGAIIFHLPNGQILPFKGADGPEEEAHIAVKNFDFARRLIFGGDIGFFESYADGQWDTPDLAQCLYVMAKNADYIQNVFHAFPLLGMLNNFRHALNKNTRSGSKRNIIAHYDLGNHFYERWLDKTMTYSSAFFSEDAKNLSDAQLKKYRTLAEKIHLNPNDTVLEIGSGWGGFAEFAAKDIGANIVGITLSPSQLNYARERIFKQGLSEKVEFRLQDYRDVDEKFDKIASIEMFEAVGRHYWQAYFDKLKQALKPGGAAGLQIITIADRFFDNYSKSQDFIQRYVFPGGMLPSPSKLMEHIHNANLKLIDVTEFGQDYAKTLHEWHGRFVTAWNDIRALGFDERFKKLWQFYLAYCEAGFKAETTNVRQITLAPS